MNQVHWNVRSLAFVAVRELFEKVSEEVEDWYDLIAERGGRAQGSIQVAAAQSSLVPSALGVADERRHIFAVAGALAAFGQLARDVNALAADFGDQDTSDLFTAVPRGIDQQL